MNEIYKKWFLSNLNSQIKLHCRFYLRTFIIYTSVSIHNLYLSSYKIYVIKWTKVVYKKNDTYLYDPKNILFLLKTKEIIKLFVLPTRLQENLCLRVSNGYRILLAMLITQFLEDLQPKKIKDYKFSDERLKFPWFSIKFCRCSF